MPDQFNVNALAARFEVLGELGKGGMGAVYRVRADGQEAALKVIQVPGGVTPELRLRFKQEFLAMSKLRHPNTLAVYDYGQLDDHTQYLTMEIVEGRELAEILAEGRPSTEQALQWLTQLLQALGFVHARHYVHRDIKAQNLRITPDGTLKLMDFGLMSQLGLPIRAGLLSGSPGYMPPEAVRGGVADASSDLYSVGCLAYEMLTGRLPFTGAIMDVIRAQAATPPEPLDRARPDLPERLGTILAKLLEKDQRARYQHAGEVLDDLSVITGVCQARESLEQRQSYLTSSLLIGRETELEALVSALATAREGAGTTVLVGAPAGVGKSRLVEEFLLGAKLDGALVLTGRCLASGLAPYEPATQALRPLLQRLAPEHRDAIAPLFPELGVAHLSADEDRVHLFDAVVAAIASLDTPIIFLLEDAHWADAQTVALFNHLARTAPPKLLSLATLRSDEVPPGSPIWETTDEGTARLLALGPLGADRLHEFLRSLLGTVAIAPEMAEKLMAATGGNPFFLTEVLRYLMEQGTLRFADGAWHFPEFSNALVLPDSVAGTVIRRVSSLCSEAVALARVAAVIGRSQSLAMLLATSGLSEELFFRDLAELVERQFLVRTEDGTAFPHDSVREALYNDLTPEARASLHQRCADFLSQGDSSHDDALFDLAHHLERGTDREAAYRVLERAAQRAYDLGAEMLAVRYWEQAAAALETLDVPERADKLREFWLSIGSTAFALAPSHGLPALEKLAAVLPASSDPENVLARIQCYRLLAVGYAFSGMLAQSFEMANRAGQLLPDDPDHPLACLNGSLPFAAYFTSGRLDELMESGRASIARFRTIDVTQVPYSISSVYLSARIQVLSTGFQGIRPSDDDLEKALVVARQVNDPEPVLYFILAAMWPAVTGRHEQAEAAIDRVVQLCRRLSMPPHPWVLYLRPYLLWQRGDFHAARGLLEQALAYPHLATMDCPRQFIVILKGQVLLELDERAAAREAFSAALTRSRDQGMMLVTIKALIGLGRVALIEGDRAEARRHLEEARTMAASGPARNPLEEAIACRLLAQVALAERDVYNARQLLNRTMAIVSAPEQDNLLQQGLCHQTFGDLHRTAGDKTAAAASYRDAGDRFHQLKNRHLLHGVNQRLDALLNATTPAPAPVEAAPEARWLQLRAMQMM